MKSMCGTVHEPVDEEVKAFHEDVGGSTFVVDITHGLKHRRRRAIPMAKDIVDGDSLVARELCPLIMREKNHVDVASEMVLRACGRAPPCSPLPPPCTL